MKMRVGLALVALLGCSERAPQSSCDQAEELMRACGDQSTEPVFGECSEPERIAAEQIIEDLNATGCATSEDKRSFCGNWDPVGLCSNHEPLGPEPEGDGARYPIILAHGFNTSTTNFWRFNDVDSLLIADGHQAVLGNVPPFDTPQVRAEHLARQIDALVEVGHEKVNLLCFSMGGIDCRYLASPDGLGYGDRIATITLLSAPNRGTAVADWALAGLGSDSTYRTAVAEWLASLYGMVISDVSEDAKVYAALQSMSKEGMADFNATYADDPNVLYQSWAGFSAVAGYASDDDNQALVELCTEGGAEMLWHPGYHDRLSPLFAPTARVVSEGAVEWHDGVATVRSSKWGHFRGCIPADHLDQVGQINDSPPDKGSGFDFRRWFRNWAYELASEGY